MNIIKKEQKNNSVTGINKEIISYDSIDDIDDVINIIEDAEKQNGKASDFRIYKKRKKDGEVVVSAMVDQLDDIKKYKDRIDVKTILSFTFVIEDKHLDYALNFGDRKLYISDFSKYARKPVDESQYYYYLNRDGFLVKYDPVNSVFSALTAKYEWIEMPSLMDDYYDGFLTPTSRPGPDFRYKENAHEKKINNNIKPVWENSYSVHKKSDSSDHSSFVFPNSQIKNNKNQYVDFSIIKKNGKYTVIIDIQEKGPDKNAAGSIIKDIPSEWFRFKWPKFINKFINELSYGYISLSNFKHEEALKAFLGFK